jgi:hypothetical protein
MIGRPGLNMDAFFIISFGSSDFFLLQYLFYYPLERNFTCTDQSTKFVFSNPSQYSCHVIFWITNTP